MNLSDMLSKINPKDLSLGLSKVRGMLSEEQVKEIESAIKNMENNSSKDSIKAISKDDIQNELKNNPNLINALKNNPNLMGKINELLNKEK